MSEKYAPTSILELLTYQNPIISHKTPRHKTNTRGNTWHHPAQLKEWKEFDDFKILEASFAGRLLSEARREGRELPPYPTIYPQIDCVIRNESDTEMLIHKWNKAVVTAALDPIQHQFHPVIWRQGDPPSTGEKLELPPESEIKRAQPLRKRANRSRKAKAQLIRRLKPDPGSISYESMLADKDSTAITFRQERFPKEYKPATKWTSESIVKRELLDASGKWRSGKIYDNYAMPIRQAYSYCIQHMCRYGCILTCQEAFIFRVKPRDAQSGKENLIFRYIERRG